MIGQKFSHYRIIEEIGSGGMGVVYRAYDERLDRTVAIKVLPPGLLAGDAAKKRFRREALALARINHPNIATLYDAGSENDTDYLVMEDIPGITLEQRIQTGSPPVGEVLTLAIQICEGLSAAHDRGIIHRDLKPGNMRLTPDGRLKILDFGLAERAAGPSQAGATVTATQAQETSGTIPYMAPEQLQGKPADLRSDLWAVGAVLYELSSGRRPFPGSVSTAIAADIIHKEPATPRYLRPEIPVGLERVILKCLEKNPSSRYVSTRAVLQDLKELSTGTSLSRLASPPSSASETPSMEIAHVLFMDIVSYSMLPMDEQEHVLRELQETVRSNREFAGAQMEDRLTRLPTGDGMALVFFGDAEAPVRCALELARSLGEHRTLKLRMGINSGPVYRIADINANHNVSGAGINMAQRVMDCGDAGHILVSKPVADVLAQVTSWRPALHDLGETEVKHGIRVHIFNLCKDGVGNPEVPKKLQRAGRRRVSLGVAAALLLGLAFASGLLVYFGKTGLDMANVWAYLLERRVSPPTHPPIGIVKGIPNPDQKVYVAVLPFEYPSNSSLGYVAEGLSAGLAARLSNLRSLYVSPVDIVKQEAAKADRESIARRLGVNLLIEGKLQESGSTVQVLLSVYDVVHARVLDTPELTGDRSKLVELAGKIDERVARQLHLQKSEGSFRAGMVPASDQAYDRFLRARFMEFEREDSSILPFEIWEKVRMPSTITNSSPIETAIGFYREAIEADRTFSLAHAGLARCYLSQFRTSEDPKLLQKAMAAAQQAAQLDDNSPDAHRILGEVYGSAKNKEKSLAELKHTLELAPNSDEAYRSLGDAYDSSGQGDEAVSAYQNAVAANSYFWLNHVALGTAYFKRGDSATALAEYQKVIELAVDNPLGYESIGNVYLREGKWDEAIPQYQKALALGPESRIYSHLGTVYFLLKRYDEAVKMYGNAVEETPGDEILWANLGDAYRRLGQTEKAGATYKRAIVFAKMDEDAQSARTLAEIGLLYAKTGDQAQALQYNRLAHAKGPGDVELIYTEGQLYVLLGQPAKAITALRQAIAMGYSRHEMWNDPENAKMQSVPEFVKLCSTNTTK
jgi:serine/threonine protein kinase/tetratricopeptide (TPR) repeat protein/TolB-like protein